jgi:hypothetical protein
MAATHISKDMVAEMDSLQCCLARAGLDDICESFLEDALSEASETTEKEGGESTYRRQVITLIEDAISELSRALGVIRNYTDEE